MSAQDAKRLADLLVRMLTESQVAGLHTASGNVVAAAASPKTAELALELLAVEAKKRNKALAARGNNKDLRGFDPTLFAHVQWNQDRTRALVFYGYGQRPTSDLLD